MRTPLLTTDRLILREIKESDIQSIYDCWMTDMDVSRYMYWKSSDDINDTKDFVEFEINNIASDKWYRWIIETKGNNQIIGTCLIYFNEDENNWDISYNLGKKYWNNGYITEAMKKIIQFAKETLNVHKIIASHAYENIASQRVIEKLGFKYVKDIPFDCNGDTIHTKGRYYELIY